MNYSPDFGYTNQLGAINNKNYNTMEDYGVGIDMINKFHEYNKTNAKAYVDQLFQKFTYNKALAQVKSIGTAIKFLDLDEYDVDSIAKKMASTAKGKVPAKASDFLFALQDQLTKTPFVDFIVDNKVTDTLVNIGNTITNAAEAAGAVTNATLSTISFGSKVMTYMPYLAVAGGLFIGYKFLTNGGMLGIQKKVLKHAGRLVKDL